MMKKTEMVIFIEEEPKLNLEELLSAAGVTSDFIQDLVDYGILELEGEEFNTDHLRRIRTVLHLQNDLEVNLPGAALILDLLDEIEEMRSQLNVLQHQVKNQI